MDIKKRLQTQHPVDRYGYQCFVLSFKSLPHIYLLFTVFSLLLIQSSQPVLAQEKPANQKDLLANPQSIKGKIAKGELDSSQIPDPHWTSDGCVACHSKTPKGKNLYLKKSNIAQGCNSCHDSLGNHDDIHPTELKASADMSRQMHKDFKRSLKSTNNLVSCATCHDLKIQCTAKNKQSQQLNPEFLRQAPYRYRTDFCYQCHEDKSYSRLNPHVQLDAKGEIVIERCGICHQTLEGLPDALSMDEVDFNIKDDLSKMCTGCHPWIPHPGGGMSFLTKVDDNIQHLKALPDNIRKRYDKMQKSSHIILPLEKGTGKVFCATCHNPHQKGVIKNTKAAAGAESENRLRQKNICGQCHNV
ncbi:MAG: hypothetical protein OEY19_02980 [Gammaproteobacteria bacterium]|nr:hypothetical protein [Gammaproteobacteria bacterium]